MKNILKRNYAKYNNLFKEFSNFDFENLDNDFYIYFNDFSKFENYIKSEGINLFKNNKNKDNTNDYFIIGYNVADSIYLYKENNIYLLENEENLDLLYSKNDNKKSKIKFLFSFKKLKKLILI